MARWGGGSTRQSGGKVQPRVEARSLCAGSCGGTRGRVWGREEGACRFDVARRTSNVEDGWAPINAMDLRPSTRRRRPALGAEADVRPYPAESGGRAGQVQRWRRDARTTISSSGVEATTNDVGRGATSHRQQLCGPTGQRARERCGMRAGSGKREASAVGGFLIAPEQTGQEKRREEKTRQTGRQEDRRRRRRRQHQQSTGAGCCGAG